MATVTAPIMTDATGQSIDSKLNSLLGKMDNLAAAFQPNASGIVYSNTTSGLTGDDVQEAIDEMAADVSEIKQSLSQLTTRYPNITPIQGSSLVHLQCGYGVGKLMGLTSEINVVSANQNSWVNIGNITVKPRNTVKVIALRTGNGTHCGMVEIQDTGLVRLYTTQALSNNSITFTVSYEAKDLL